MAGKTNGKPSAFGRGFSAFVSAGKMSRHNFVAKQLWAPNSAAYVGAIPDNQRITRDWYLEWEPGEWLGGIHPAFDSLAGAESDALEEVGHGD